MIYEFALDPEAVATWGASEAFRFFKDKFGVGRPRILSTVPTKNNWRSLVFKAAGVTESSVDEGDLSLKRLEVMVELLLETHVQRDKTIIIYNFGGKTWLENAETSGLRYPFHAIIANANPRANKKVLVSQTLGMLPNPLWDDIRIASTPGRSVQDLIGTLGPMLRIADDVAIIDPYFRANRRERREVMVELLRSIVAERACPKPSRIQILVSADYDNAPSNDFFNSECAEKMPNNIPAGLQVAFKQLSKKDGGQRLHNRYLLTNIGGVIFGNTFESGDAGETDDANLMDSEQYWLRWNQYVAECEFNVVGTPITIAGNMG